MGEGLPRAADPEAVHTPGSLAAALRALAGARSVRAIEAASRTPGGKARLSKSTVQALFDPATLCRQATLEIYLEVVGIPVGEWDRWFDAWERARTTSGAFGAVRARDASWKLLGVHEPIEMPGTDPNTLPVYVPRDVDGQPGTGVRARLAEAAVSGGFVVLVGGSSTGKTRCLWEAVRAELGQWWLRRPSGADELAGWAADPPPRLVLWLDELQNHLNEGGLTAAAAERLIAGGCVLVGTLWPSYYRPYSATPDAAFGGGPDADPYEDERRTLALARVIRLPERPTPAEWRRARALADGSGDGREGGGDARLREALRHGGYGFPQTIAAAPQLVDRWKDGNAYETAVLTAAVDAVRLGVRTPIPAALLRAAAPGYCSLDERAQAPSDWFEAALAYATQRLNGAIAALTPVAGGTTMGTVAGYRLADYLLEHLLPDRRRYCPPATFWEACLTHLRFDAEPAVWDDLVRLGHGAFDRLRYCYALPLLDHPTLSWDGRRWTRLEGLLDRRTATEELQEWADAGERWAVQQLASRLARQGKVRQAIDLLRKHAVTGGSDVAKMLAEELVFLGGVQQAISVLRAETDTGARLVSGLSSQLADFLAEHGEAQELRYRADAEDVVAAGRLAELLGELCEMQELRDRAAAGSEHARKKLAEVLAEQGEVEEAITIARDLADGEDSFVKREMIGLLDDLLTQKDSVEELRARADAGDRRAVYSLAHWLAEHGQVEEAITVLRDHADSDYPATRQLANLLAEHGQVEEAIRLLRDRVDAIAPAVSMLTLSLIDLLAEHGDVQQLRERADAGSGYAARRLADLLAERGDVQQLRDRADTGDGHARYRLGDLLADRGHVEELRDRADAGDVYIADRLARWLAERGDVQQLRDRADTGDLRAARWLADLLAERGEVSQARTVLTAMVDAADEDAAPRMIALLRGSGRYAEAECLWRFGLTAEGEIASGPT
ncbi:hypothetical protein [Actinomadura fibrosa]|uniref:Tetratricopeptide repeat protein n=1 Tax=Actinomadura fibrosa TaxID=111802 RepID=A0ABW2XZ56_9ACTN|nr:hypothetical protein [Actinomadura fibrosa]